MLEIGKVDAVAGCDHHRSGEPILTQATHQMLADGRLCAQRPDEVGCPISGCPQRSGVIVPLRCGDEVSGGSRSIRRAPRSTRRRWNRR